MQVTANARCRKMVGSLARPNVEKRRSLNWDARSSKEMHLEEGCAASLSLRHCIRSIRFVLERSGNRSSIATGLPRRTFISPTAKRLVPAATH
jgi:hypothetical protein